MTRYSVAAAVLAADLTATSPVWAQTTAEEAETLRAALSALIHDELLAEADAEEIVVLLDGDIRVEPDGEAYLATLPALTISTLFDPEELRIPAIEATVRPTEDGAFAASLQLPFRVERVDTGGDTEALMAAVVIAASRVEFTFHPELGIFTHADVSVEGIGLEGEEVPSGAAFSLAGLTVRWSSEEVTSGHFDSVGEIVISDLALSGPDGTNLALGRLALSGTSEGANLIALRLLAESLDEVMDRMEEDRAAADGLQRIMEETPLLFSAAGFAMALEGLDFVSPGQPPLSIDSAGTAASVGDLDQDAARVDLDLTFGGAESSMLAPFADFVPTSVLVDVALEGIPVAALLDSARDVGGGLALGGPAMARTMAVTALQEALLASGTTLNIANLDVQLPGARFELGGALSGDATALLGVTGAADLVATGLDRLIEAASAHPMAAEVVPVLGMLGVMGQLQGEAGPDAVRTYRLEATGDGQFLLNGTDLGALMGG